MVSRSLIMVLKWWTSRLRALRSTAGYHFVQRRAPGSYTATRLSKEPVTHNLPSK